MSSTQDKQTAFCQLGQAVIETEAAALQSLSQRIDESFAAACSLILDTRGRVIVMGMGKSGHIANKLAATLASTGTPAFFVHPGEASHGDMGMITADDIVIALSNSGETPELTTLLPLLKRQNIPLISLCGNHQSSLAEHANVHLDVSVSNEACPLGLAPTTSTTVALAMGDALAIALLQARGFSADDFARSHPGGQLGRKLLLRVDDLMHTGDDIPYVDVATTLSGAIMEVTAKSLGFTCVTDSSGQLRGIFTDGDLRRSIEKEYDIHTTAVSQCMTKNPKTIKQATLAAEALHMMQTYKITSLIVVTDNEQADLVGIIHLHDLLRAGVA